MFKRIARNTLTKSNVTVTAEIEAKDIQPFRPMLLNASTK
jgi:hypothetical protein